MTKRVLGYVWHETTGSHLANVLEGNQLTGHKELFTPDNKRQIGMVWNGKIYDMTGSDTGANLVLLDGTRAAPPKAFMKLLADG